MNVIDAVHPSEAIAISAVAKALAQVNGKQCDPAGGACRSDPLVKDGPPPIGGDEPGFFTSGDLPPAGRKVYPWVATPVEPPKDDFLGSQCEGVNWATIAAKSKSSRVYLIQESGKNFFGLNEVVLTMKDAKAAGKQVGRDQIQSFGLQDPKAHSNGHEAQEGDRQGRPKHQGFRLDGGSFSEVDTRHRKVPRRNRFRGTEGDLHLLESEG